MAAIRFLVKVMLIRRGDAIGSVRIIKGPQRRAAPKRNRKWIMKHSGVKGSWFRV